MRAVAPGSRRRVHGRPAGRRHRPRGAAAGRFARALAQPAGMGRVGGRARPRLSEASGPPRRSGGKRAQGPHPDEPLQRAPAMAGRRPCGPRRRGRRRLRLAGGGRGGGGVAGAAGAERRGFCAGVKRWRRFVGRPILRDALVARRCEPPVRVVLDPLPRKSMDSRYPFSRAYFAGRTAWMSRKVYGTIRFSCSGRAASEDGQSSRWGAVDDVQLPGP